MTPGINFPAFVDSSMLGTFKSCQRQWLYQYLMHLSPVEKSIHLVAGGAFAKGLEHARLHFYTVERNEKDAVLMGQLAAIKEWGDYADHHGDTKSLPNILLAIEAYFEHHGFSTDLIQPYFYERGEKKDHPAVEFSFALPIGRDHPTTGEPLLYVGRYDMLGLYNNTLFVVDEKTTGRLGSSWAGQWDLRSQFTGYCWAAQQYGFPVAGAIVRGVSILKHDFGFAESITYRSDHLIERWLETTRYYIDQMILCWKNNQYIHNLDGACTAYSGCPFKIVCDKREPTDWLSNYVVRKWNPVLGMEE